MIEQDIIYSKIARLTKNDADLESLKESLKTNYLIIKKIFMQYAI